MPGWIKLHRSILGHWLFSFKEPEKALAWIDLLLSASHSAHIMLIKGRVVKVKRGQVALSQLTMQKRWGWSQNKVKRFLKTLKNERMIVFETNDLTTLVSILNYNSFQNVDVKGERPNGRTDGRADERATDDQTDDNQEGKELKKGKNNPLSPPKGGKRKSQIPDGFPDEKAKTKAKAYWSKKGRTDLDVDDQADEFRTYCEANGKQYLDWNAGFKTWYVRAIKFNKKQEPDKGLFERALDG